jgi:pimeloyl-ACP methyl ester carboxylesterase
MMRWGATILQAPVHVALACSRALVEADFRAEMRDIEVPTMIVHGDRDCSVPLEVGGLPTAELIAGSTLKVYPGAPHGLLYTHMEALHADMWAFMRRTRRPDPNAQRASESRIPAGPIAR